jgi:hypothetical protein
MTSYGDIGQQATFLGGYMEYEERIAARRQTFKKILDACSWYTVEDLQELVPDVGEGMKELLDAWEGSDRIFSVQGKKGRLYPQFEFDQNYQPLSIIYDVLSALQENDELAIAGWFVFKNESVASLVDGKMVAVAPMAALADHRAILRAAKEEGGAHFE